MTWLQRCVTLGRASSVTPDYLKLNPTGNGPLDEASRAWGPTGKELPIGLPTITSTSPTGWRRQDAALAAYFKGKDGKGIYTYKGEDGKGKDGKGENG